MRTTRWTFGRRPLFPKFVGQIAWPLEAIKSRVETVLTRRGRRVSLVAPVTGTMWPARPEQPSSHDTPRDGHEPGLGWDTWPGSSKTWVNRREWLRIRPKRCHCGPPSGLPEIVRPLSCRLARPTWIRALSPLSRWTTRVSNGRPWPIVHGSEARDHASRESRAARTHSGMLTRRSSASTSDQSRFHRSRSSSGGSRGSPIYSIGLDWRAASLTPVAREVHVAVASPLGSSLPHRVSRSAPTLVVSRQQSSLDVTARQLASPPFEDVYIRACTDRGAPNRRRI